MQPAQVYPGLRPQSPAAARTGTAAQSGRARKHSRGRLLCRTRQRERGGGMLNQATLDKVHQLRLTGMVAAYQKQTEDPETATLSFDDRFGLLVDHHWTWRDNQAMARRLKKSKLDSEPCVEDINYHGSFGTAEGPRARAHTLYYLGVAMATSGANLPRRTFGPVAIVRRKGLLAPTVGPRSRRDLSLRVAPAPPGARSMSMQQVPAFSFTPSPKQPRVFGDE